MTDFILIDKYVIIHNIVYSLRKKTKVESKLQHSSCSLCKISKYVICYKMKCTSKSFYDFVPEVETIIQF